MESEWIKKPRREETRWNRCQRDRRVMCQRESGSGERKESKRRPVAARTGRRVVHTRRPSGSTIVRAPLHLIARLQRDSPDSALGHVVGHIVDAGACPESRTRSRKCRGGCESHQRAV